MLLKGRLSCSITGMMLGPPSGTAVRLQRPLILCVDDEPLILESLRDTLHRRFDVRSAASGAEGLEQLADQAEEFAVVISDMRMPAMPGSVFLRECRRVAPDTVRILLTGYADLQAAIDAVNDAHLFRFLTKPCDPQELMRACTAGLDQHRLQTAERVLLEQTLKGSVQALVDVLALASPAAFGRSARVRATVERLARAIDLNDAWELEVSALLVHVGAVTLPGTTAAKLYAGGQLNASEQAMVERVPAATLRILRNIPRLEGVLQILESYNQPFAAAGGSQGSPIGARMLRIALDYDALEAHGMGNTEALATLAGRVGVYDPELLGVFASVVEAGVTHRRVLEIGLRHLRAGMMLADDVQTIDGALIVARGQTVTDELVERLGNLGGAFISQPLLVLDVEPSLMTHGAPTA